MTSLEPPAGKPTRMRAVECNGCDKVVERPKAYEATPAALLTKKRRRLSLVTRRASDIAAPCCEFSDTLHSIKKQPADGMVDAHSPQKKFGPVRFQKQMEKPNRSCIPQKYARSDLSMSAVPPESGHRAECVGCPLSANSCHEQAQKTKPIR